MTANPKITLIFVNYRSLWYLSLALKSLFSKESDWSCFEVIVVNNDQRERTALNQLSQHFPFQILSPLENSGFGGGVNYGVKRARGNVLGFLNPDTQWPGEQLHEIYPLFLRESFSGIVGLTLMDKKGGKEQWSSGRVPTLLRLLKNNFLPFHFFRHFPVEWVSGGGLFISKDTFQDLGGFDERFFLYFEDVDLCLRAKERGAPIIQDPRYTLLHQGGKSFSSRKHQKRIFYRSQEQYFKKHRPRFEFFIVHFWHRMVHGL